MAQIKLNNTAAEINTVIAWGLEQIRGDLQKEFDALWVVTSSATGNSYWADKASSTTQTVTVTTKFNGTATDADSTPTGWTKDSTGTYKISSTGAVSNATFTYTASEGTYAGLTTSQSKGASSITTNYPIFIGWMETKPTTGQEAYNSINSNRYTAKQSGTNVSLTNTLSTAGYWVVLTHNAATATSAGLNILDSVISGQTIKVSDSISMSGYKLYVSSNSASAGGSFDNVTYSISL